MIFFGRFGAKHLLLLGALCSARIVAGLVGVVVGMNIFRLPSPTHTQVAGTKNED